MSCENSFVIFIVYFSHTFNLLPYIQTTTFAPQFRRYFVSLFLLRLISYAIAFTALEHYKGTNEFCIYKRQPRKK